jgi:ribose transport system ATP-binding protein
LEVRGLNRGAAIKDVSFKRARRAKSSGFAGLMGAGRTEVARAIFGADKIDSGEIYIKGNKVSIKSPRDAVKHGIGYLSEDRKHFGLATGMERRGQHRLATMKRFLSGQFRPEAVGDSRRRQNFRQADRHQDAELQQRRRNLSGGNQQKIVIAKWLVRDSEILFFDEPTRGIDVGAKSEIYKLLNAWRSRAAPSS